MPAEWITARLGAGETVIELPLSVQLQQLAQDFGFAHYLLAAFPFGDLQDFSCNCLATDWPAPLRQSYEGRDAFRDCDLVARLKASVLPVFLRGGFTKGGADADIAASFSQNGLKVTWSVSLHDQRLRHVILALSGDRDAPCAEEGRQLLYRACQIVEAYGRQDEDRDAPSERLSGREIECLRWSAAGKSSEEIAIILGISSHTVSTYLKSAMRKLDAVNRMQAVARACRLRLL